jgi:hypothetical protein
VPDVPVNTPFNQLTGFLKGIKCMIVPHRTWFAQALQHNDPGYNKIKRNQKENPGNDLYNPK